MKITLAHVYFYLEKQKQPSWVRRYYDERGKRWPSILRREEKRNRLRIHELIPFTYDNDKNFEIRNLMTLLCSYRERGLSLIDRLNDLALHHSGDKEKRLCKKWLKKIHQRREQIF